MRESSIHTMHIMEMYMCPMCMFCDADSNTLSVRKGAVLFSEAALRND